MGQASPGPAFDRVWVGVLGVFRLPGLRGLGFGQARSCFTIFSDTFGKAHQKKDKCGYLASSFLSYTDTKLQTLNSNYEIHTPETLHPEPEP